MSTMFVPHLVAVITAKLANNLVGKGARIDLHPKMCANEVRNDLDTVFNAQTMTFLKCDLICKNGIGRND